MPGTEPKGALSTELNRLSEITARDSKVKFTSLAHLLTEDFLKGCYRELNHQAAGGIDQVSYASYGENLETGLLDSISYGFITPLVLRIFEADVIRPSLFLQIKCSLIGIEIL